jgi:tripartite-type tricarboxylate transporter receptor subunit TctC
MIWTGLRVCGSDTGRAVRVRCLLGSLSTNSGWLNAEARKAFSSPDLKARLEGQGLTLPLGSPEDFASHIAAETARWGDVIRKGNIKMGSEPGKS